MTSYSSAGHEVRIRCRSKSLTSPTASLANGHIQANLLVLPSEYAPDFRDLCARNPVPCPLLASSDIVGDATSIDDKTLIDVDGGHDFDLRTDLPKYNVYRDGKLIESKTDVTNDWERDHIAFLLGCSFSFEGALEAAGLKPKHWEKGCNVPMYKTTMRLAPAGKFTDGQWIVSMRPYKSEDVERVRDVTRPFREMHGEPMAWGLGAAKELGITDLGKPDFGDVVEVNDGEVPVFWVCGYLYLSSILTSLVD